LLAGIRMNLPGAVIAMFGLSLAGLRAADATTPLDPARRNGDFSPGATASIPRIAPDVTVPRSLSQPIVTPPTTSASADRLSGLAVVQPAAKRAKSPAVNRPDTAIVRVSANPVRMVLSTSDRLLAPPRVTKYQDSMAAARATNMARFPAGNPATVSRLSRFVFRRNPPDPGAAIDPAAAIPAGGRSRESKLNAPR
jgi:hypothetical protein